VFTEQANLRASKAFELLSESVWVHSNILPSMVLALFPARLRRRVSSVPALSDLETLVFGTLKNSAAQLQLYVTVRKPCRAYWNHVYMLGQGATSAKVHLLMSDSVINMGQMIDTGHTYSV